MTGSEQPLTPSTQRKRSRNTPRPRWPPGSARRSAGGVWPPCWPAWPWWWPLLGGGGWLWFTPTASVSVDINPSLELRLNRFSRVVAVEGANADGQALAQELDLRFLDCAAALEAILASDTVSALLAQDSALTIAVSGQDEAQCQDLLTQAQHCTAGQETPTASPPAARSMTRPTRPASPWASTGLTWPSTTWTPPLPRRRSKT